MPNLYFINVDKIATYTDSTNSWNLSLLFLLLFGCSGISCMAQDCSLCMPEDFVLPLLPGEELKDKYRRYLFRDYVEVCVWLFVHWICLKKLTQIHEILKHPSSEILSFKFHNPKNGILFDKNVLK